MPEPSLTENEFLSQLTALVEKNISNEQFGVSELADEMNMSRSNLLRKVKKLTKLSVSQLISQVRLKRGMDLLRTSSLNVSEVSHQVGFSSTSYFIKCFREYYGYPPGEVGKRNDEKISPVPVDLPVNQTSGGVRKRNLFIPGSIALAIVLTIGAVAYFLWPSPESIPLEKSIAVLPFKNDSNDSTNVYLINGLMESTLNNLQQIKDLKVISRTSVEKYRNTSISIPEMAKELNVNYFVEGSGQKIGDHILLNIQLIEASTDKHLWANQYRREVKDIFELQKEIAKNIAQEIQVIIGPDVEQRIEKNPTDNYVAYDYYLKGRDTFHKGFTKNLTESIGYFKKAIEHDPKFALAYAQLAMVLYYLDLFQAEKKYTAEINSYADKALLYDSKLAESLVAKALFYILKKEYELAIPYLEKALEYNPNSMLVINFLSDIYNAHTPNTTKYLENALKAVRLNIAALDSVNKSYIYLHVSNAFVQTGFIDESITYINKSLDYYPKNPFAYVKVLFEFAKNKDLKGTKERLLKELAKDTVRFDVVKEIGRVSYSMRDYEEAYKYYKKFTDIRTTHQLDIFRNEDLAIGFVCSKLGYETESKELVKSFKDFADNDRTIYKHFHLGLYYAYLGDAQKAVEHFTLFSKEDNYQYWILLISHDPIVDGIKDTPPFKKVMRDIETKFWKTNKEIRVTLEEKGLL